MNTLSIIARLTREPESKFTPSGKQITSFGIAYDVGYGDYKHACFLDCKLWGDRGQNFVKYVKKGHQVALTGALDMDSWEDKQTGQKRTKHTLDVRDFTLMNNNRDGGQSEQREAPAPRQQAQQGPARQEQSGGDASYQAGMDDSEIPF